MELFRAFLILAWALLRTLVAPLFGARRGLVAFEASYAKDRLPAVRPEERRALSAFGGCIACGLCDVGEGARAAASGGVYAGVMDLMLASSRSMPDFDVAARSFEAIGDERLAELEARCPTRVPMRRIAAFVRSKALDTGRS
jgi:succinate dehydrogenase/fumarate reductase-like Fe-S protein